MADEKKEMPPPRVMVPSASAAGPQPVPAVADVSDQTWEKTVEKAQTPVVVMFYSPSCVYCRQMELPFRTLAGEFRDTVVFAAVNVVANMWTAARYGVRSTPTFTCFCNGKPVREMAGAVYPALLKKMIEESLVHGSACARNSSALDYEITGYG